MSKSLQQELFACIDCETTGLDTKNDRVIEVAVCTFTFSEGIKEQYSTLVNPSIPIPKDTTAIHNITDEMVEAAPLIQDVLKTVRDITGSLPIMGHNISFDTDILSEEASRASIPCSLQSNIHIDTLRLARLYGQSPTNSLSGLGAHFGIQSDPAHRALHDVQLNIEVFKHLTSNFSSLKKITERLKQPIKMSRMPLGKHKGRLFSEIPADYLSWAARQAFDMDLMFSIKSELSNRKKSPSFQIASNPFSSL